MRPRPSCISDWMVRPRFFLSAPEIAPRTECACQPSAATMVALLCFFLALLASPFKSNSRLEAENAALRHQLMVLGRKVRGRHFTNSDRLFFIQLYRWFPSVLRVRR